MPPNVVVVMDILVSQAPVDADVLARNEASLVSRYSPPSKVWCQTLLDDTDFMQVRQKVEPNAQPMGAAL